MKEYQTSYVLDNFQEFERLERQSTQKNYSLENELQYLDYSGTKRVLDAGCGSGLLSRFLKEKNNKLEIVACDYSELRVQQAKRFNENNFNIEFVHSNLEKLPYEDKSFDIVVSRFVYEYLQSPVLITTELRRVLRPGGILYLIDLDGVFLNFWTSNKRFNFLLNKIERGVDFDLFVGRKLPSILHMSGLQKVDWKLTVHEFKNAVEVEEEIKNNIDRLNGARTKFSKILKSEEAFEEFKKLYIEEMRNISLQGNLLFFNKVIAWGVK